MKKLLFVFALLLSIVRIDATTVQASGKLDWEITEPRCTFKLEGTISNRTTAPSGTIRLVLWATRAPFPSPGTIVAEQILGSLNSGTQFKSFKINTTSNIPNISGEYYFTVAVAEFSGGIWRNVAISDTGIRDLKIGDFVGQTKWSLPNLPVVSPASALQKKNILTLTEKATGLFNEFPGSSQTNSKLRFASKSKVSVSNRAQNKPVSFTYRKKNGKYNSQKVIVGDVAINYGGKDNFVSKTKLTLYFHTEKSGTYQSVESGRNKEAVWGSFTLK
ncbi:MAG: hypothetical protein HC845_07735 [Akkermansiaceae bacterium]|nr:hypothetical protein [Akkermansiaceae bacterium]